MSDIKNYIALVESAEQLDEINWKKGLATAATAGAMALGGGAHAQGYLDSPLHKDLTNISNKLDQKIAQQKSANKLGAFGAASAITGGLAALGNAWQNSKFKDAATEIMSKGPYKIYKNLTPLDLGGTMTIIYGSGKMVAMTDTSHLGMGGGVYVNTYDNETSPGRFEMRGGKTVYDFNKNFLYNKNVFGGETEIKLKLVDSGEGADPAQDWRNNPELRELTKNVHQQVIDAVWTAAEPISDAQDTKMFVYYDKEGNILKTELEKSTGNKQYDNTIQQAVKNLKKIPEAQKYPELVPNWSGRSVVRLDFSKWHQDKKDRDAAQGPEKTELLKIIGSTIRSKINVNPNSQEYKQGVVLINFDNEGYITNVRMQKTTGDSELDNQLMKQIVELDQLPPEVLALKKIDPKFSTLGLRTNGIKGMERAQNESLEFIKNISF